MYKSKESAISYPGKAKKCINETPYPYIVLYFADIDKRWCVGANLLEFLQRRPLSHEMLWFNYSDAASELVAMIEL